MMIAILSLALWVQSDKAATVVILKEWWLQDHFLQILDLEPERQQKLVAAMNDYRIRYGLLQTQNRELRAALQARYVDGKTSDAEIRAFYDEQVRPSSLSLRDFRVEVRLFLRGFLGPDRLQRLLSHHPRFFQGIWFHQPRIPMIEGDEP